MFRRIIDFLIVVSNFKHIYVRSREVIFWVELPFYEIIIIDFFFFFRWGWWQISLLSLWMSRLVVVFEWYTWGNLLFNFHRSLNYSTVCFLILINFIERRVALLWNWHSACFFLNLIYNLPRLISQRIIILTILARRIELWFIRLEAL